MVTQSVTSMDLNAYKTNDLVIVVPEDPLTSPPTELLSQGNFNFKLIHVSMLWNQGRNWIGRTFTRHGGPHYPRWWKSEINKSVSIKYGRNDLSRIDWSNVHCYIYIKRNGINHKKRKRDFLKYIGGQCHVVCDVHNLPLIVSNKKERKCCYQEDDSPCNKICYYTCPEDSCQVKLCKHCFRKCNMDQINNISPIQDMSDDDNNNDTSVSTETTDESDDNSDSICTTYSLDNNIAIADIDSESIDNNLFPENITQEELDEFVVTPPTMTELNQEDVITESIPTTDAGDYAYVIEEEMPKDKYIGSHVIFNQCGSILSRKDSSIEGFKHQKHFLQRIVSITTGNSIPLLYPESMLFPSIFWKQMNNCGSIPGAIPSCLLTRENSTIFGFERLKTMICSRSFICFFGDFNKPCLHFFQFRLAF